MENEIVLTTPGFAFDLAIRRQGGGLLYEVVRSGDLERNVLREFRFAEDAARHLYERGCTGAHEMISLGLEAMG